MRTTVLLSILAVSVSCSRPEAIAETPPVPLDPGLALGPPVRAGSLAVWPVLADDVPDIGPLRTLEEAQARGELGIHEREEADVETLMIENRGDVPILACAGVIFVGGKQDRQLGEDIVVDAHSTAFVKAFCVEQDRWSDGRTFVVAKGKANRAVRVAGQYDGDQSRVWQGVAAARKSMGLSSGSYGAVANSEQKLATKLLAHLRGQKGHLVGYAYAINGKVTGMRTFAHPALLEPRLDALVRAVCVESGQSAAIAQEALTASDETRRIASYLRMASDSYDSGEYDLAEAHSDQVLALDPRNEPAQELRRIAQESRYVASRNEIREDLNDEWRAVMAQLEYTAIPGPDVLRYQTDQNPIGAGTNFDVHIAGAAAIPVAPVGIIPEPRSAGATRPGFSSTRSGGIESLFDYVLSFDGAGVTSGGAALPPRSGRFLGRDIGVDIRGLSDVFSLLRSATESTERTVETSGGNRNHYKTTAIGNQATCSIRDENGRWIPLTRDWTAR